MNELDDLFNRVRRGVLLTGLLGAGTALTACGGGGSDAPAPAPGPSPAPAPTPAPSPAPAPADPPAQGTVTLVAGSLDELPDTAVRSDADGPGPLARFRSPGGLAVDAGGNVYVADTMNHTIRKIWTDNMVTTFAGAVRVPGGVDGFIATFSFPAGVGIDGAGNLYVTDGWSAQALSGNVWWTSVRKVSPAGAVSTLMKAASPNVILGPCIVVEAATGFWFTYGGAVRRVDQAGASTSVTVPDVGRGIASLAVDKSGTVYFGDRNTIRKVVPGQPETVLAGAGTPGYTDDAGTAARFDFYQPGVTNLSALMTSMVVDSSGNLYVADTNNRVIRRITPAGVVSTVSTQPFAFASPPRGLALAGDKKLYVTSANAVLRIDLR